MTSDEGRQEDLAQLLTRLLSEREWSQSELARRMGVTSAAVSAWVNRKRGTGRGPTRTTIQAMAAAFGLPERIFFAAAGRRTPGPLDDQSEARIMELYRSLTAEEQRIIALQLKALASEDRAS